MDSGKSDEGEKAREGKQINAEGKGKNKFGKTSNRQ